MFFLAFFAVGASGVLIIMTGCVVVILEVVIVVIMLVLVGVAWFIDDVHGYKKVSVLYMLILAALQLVSIGCDAVSFRVNAKCGMLLVIVIVAIVIVIIAWQ